MLQRRAGLSASDLDAIAALEMRVLAADGGRLKLEWGTLRSRSGGRVDDLLWFDGDDLVGFAGLYAHGGPLEITGMVDPLHRRRGVGSELLAAALGQARERGVEQLLLVCPRTPAGTAASFAAAHGGVFDHAEHALLLTGQPADGPSLADVSLRPIEIDDLQTVEDILAEGFGHRMRVDAEQVDSERRHQIVIERASTVVGYLRLTLTDGVGGVYGFVVVQGRRGQGVGRDALRRCCRQLRSEGATRIGLEVETENERALGLYTSLGFEPVITEDYFAIRTA